MYLVFKYIYAVYLVFNTFNVFSAYHWIVVLVKGII